MCSGWAAGVHSVKVGGNFLRLVMGHRRVRRRLGRWCYKGRGLVRAFAQTVPDIAEIGGLGESVELVEIFESFGVFEVEKERRWGV